MAAHILSRTPLLCSPILREERNQLPPEAQPSSKGQAECGSGHTDTAPGYVVSVWHSWARDLVMGKTGIHQQPREFSPQYLQVEPSWDETVEGP